VVNEADAIKEEQSVPAKSAKNLGKTLFKKKLYVKQRHFMKMTNSFGCVQGRKHIFIVYILLLSSIIIQPSTQQICNK
jgi:hypothetical protein